YGREEPLPRDVERRAFRNGVQWYRHSRLLITAGRRPELEAALRANKAAEPTPAERSQGDGSLGILEGYASTIHADGDQDQLIAIRADCNAETAMVFALDWNLHRNPESRDTTRKLLNF